MSLPAERISLPVTRATMNLKPPAAPQDGLKQLKTPVTLLTVIDGVLLLPWNGQKHR
jgi:hypothetical protein